ncbi:MAG: hydrogenase expression/formation protein HypE [Myxococcales bacterium]|nr:hydrogenase expression/formation protein HypE [Myxococcales bacterium]
MSFGACPIPVEGGDVVVLAHGGGGRLQEQLLDKLIMPIFANDVLTTRHDGAILPTFGGKTVVTTDSFVVTPRFFPGGNIGKLAVSGTINDLAMCGARPVALTVALVIEEGFVLAELRTILHAMQEEAQSLSVSIVAGDTKVVGRGQVDGLFITTTGVGEVVATNPVLPRRVVPGDAVIVSGDIGRHGMAVLCARSGFLDGEPLMSDVASLWRPVSALFAAGLDVHCLRDATRGGLAAVVTEIATSASVTVELDEPLIPVDAKVRGICELFGIDPVHVANEGRFVAFVPDTMADRVLDILRGQPGCHNACRVGQVVPARIAPVILRTAIGVERILDRPFGEQLPRIC